MSLQIVRQDITKMCVDAIVNTTNEKMVGYSGVDLAIHEAAGAELDAECAKLVPLELGFAKITKGYNLDCKYIVHTFGPVWQGGKYGEKALLKSCYLESLRLAKDFQCQSIAFPLISSGIYGYPKDQVLRYAMQVISEFLYENEMEVFLCVFDRQSYELNEALLSDLRSFINSSDSYDYLPLSAAPLASTEAPGKESSRLYGTEAPSEDLSPLYCFETRAPQAASNRSWTEEEKLREYLKKMDKGFADTLFDYIDKRGMTDVECYKKANIDRRTFNKIKNIPHYKPSKQTAVALAIALRLNLEDTQHLLSTAGITLSQSNLFDKIIRYFIREGNYDVFEINEALFEFDQVLLGT